MNKLYLFIVGLIFLMTSCENDVAPAVDDKPVTITLSSRQNEIVKDYLNFSYDFFSAVATCNNSQENVVVSPFSGINILSMLLNSNGNGDYLANVISPSAGIDDINELNLSLYQYFDKLARKINTDLSSCRSVWMREGYEMSPSLKDVFNDYYLADFRQFKSGLELERMFNSWILEKSNGLIPAIDLDFNDNIIGMLSDNLYFKGNWRRKFDVEDSHPGVFHNIDGTSSDVIMMEQTSPLEWYKHEKFDAVSMHFAGGEFAAFFILPSNGNDIEELLADAKCLTLEGYDSGENYSSGKYGLNDVPIVLPRFEVDSEVNLSPVFSKMFGFNDMEFSGIKLNQMFVFQRSKIKIDEVGAQLSSVTVPGTVGSVAFEKGEPFVLDRPFIYIIRENSMGVILQMAKIVRL